MMDMKKELTEWRRKFGPNPRQCVNSKGELKAWYRSRWHANKAVEILKASPEFRPHPLGWELTAYRCKVCERWHVGNIKPEDT